MRVTILGSGASEGIPAFLCECSVCAHARRVRGKEIRRNSFALVTSASNETLLIDVPPHFKTSWDQGRFREEALAAVLVTHRHDDHSLGLHYLWDAIPHNPARSERPLPVCMPSDIYELRVRPHLASSDGASDARGRRSVTATIVHAYREFRVGPFKVTPLETGHFGAPRGGSEVRTGEPAGAADTFEDFGHLIEDSDGTRVAYVVDAPAFLPQPTIERLRAPILDCLVSECTLRVRAAAHGHSDVRALCALKEALTPHLTIATHVGHDSATHRSLERVLRRQDIRLAYDGMSVRVRGTRPAV